MSTEFVAFVQIDTSLVLTSDQWQLTIPAQLCGSLTVLVLLTDTHSLWSGVALTTVLHYQQYKLKLSPYYAMHNVVILVVVFYRDGPIKYMCL